MVWISKLSRTGYVVEHPGGVILDGGFLRGHPKTDGSVFIHFIVKSLSPPFWSYQGLFFLCVTAKGPTCVNRGFKSLLNNFIMKHAQGQGFLFIKLFSWILDFFGAAEEHVSTQSLHKHSQFVKLWGSVARFLQELQKIHSHATPLGVHNYTMVTEQSHHQNFGHLRVGAVVDVSELRLQ